MQVNLLTVNLVNFEMGLFLLGILFAVWTFSILVLPLLFGFPYCIYWAIRGWAEWRCTLLYLVTPCLWMFAFLISMWILLFFYPFVWGFLVESEGFSLGLGAGVILSMARIVFSRATRLNVTRNHLEFLKAHLTLEGSEEIKTMTWPDPSED